MTAQVLCGPCVYAVAAQARQGQYPHRGVTWLFALAFETTSNYSILNFLPEHLFLCPALSKILPEKVTLLINPCQF